ncbi:ABC transporter permease [Liquorilactobacillus sicerae]|uniref:ABC transporter permease n=1 Tax=Liquorilactobacillus sicerae TaxID=1416943 RepID=UPI00248142B8|nr:FtsX-like permease family protein [Liquorilactobacillus sicerae]
MFLAFKEIRHEKLRYGLIISMIVLIAYLVFILTSLAQGLAEENTAAIKSWDGQRIILNQDANINLSQSLITKKASQQQKITRQEAYLGQAAVVAKKADHAKISAQFIGIKNQQFIAKKLDLTQGKLPQTPQQIVVDQSFKDQGYHLNDHLQLNSQTTSFKIVGFVKNAKLSIAPVIYGQLKTWKKLKNLTGNFQASAIVSKKASYQATTKELKSYSISKFISELPGYAAQNATFSLMIGFLMVIALIVIAVFLYILTIQKTRNYAVLRAQGVPAAFLVKATLAQAGLLVIVGICLAGVLTGLTAWLIPASVPMSFQPAVLISLAAGLIVTAMLGALIPIWTIIKIDPISVIGG